MGNLIDTFICVVKEVIGNKPTVTHDDDRACMISTHSSFSFYWQLQEIIYSQRLS